jgi:hypothetical protein
MLLPFAGTRIMPIVRAIWPVTLVALTAIAAACAGGLASSGAEPSSRPTFAGDIGPIIVADCAPCHRPGGSAPFSLLSYDEVHARAEEIARAVRDGHMPPWSAAPPPASRAIRDARSLTPRQIAAFQHWIDGGLPPGDFRRAPGLPTIPTGWPLGLPDLVLSLPHALHLPADSRDTYRVVVVPLGFPVDHAVAAIDYRPGASGGVEHIAFAAVPDDQIVGAYDALPGLSGLLGVGSLEAFGDQVIAADRNTRDLGVWVPGVPARRLPDGIAHRLPARSNLALQVRLRTLEVDVVEDGQVALYFSPTPNTMLTDLQIPPALGLAAGIALASDAGPVTIEDAFTLPVDVEVHGARGHAHHRGRELVLTAMRPDGRVERLLHIGRWDVRFQETYIFSTPVRLRAGTVVRVAIVYDPAAGPAPADPARGIAWGRQPSNEIGAMTLVIAAPPPGDAARLAAARAEHLRNQLQRRTIGGG